MEAESSADIDPDVFAGAATGYILFRLFGLTESLVHKTLEYVPNATQKALQASCKALRSFMNTRVKVLKLVGDDGPEHMVGELLDRFPSAHQLKLDHISWATIATLTRQSRRLLRALQAVEITGWKARENLIEVEHAIGSLLSCTPCLASLSISLVKVGPHCLPKSVLGSLTSLTELRLDAGPVDCQFAFNAICLLTRLQRVELAMTFNSCSLKSITNLAHLRHLHLECQAISAPDMDRIAQLSRLTALSLEAKLPATIAPSTWAHHTTALAHLTLRHGSINNSEVQGLSKLSALNKLALDAVEFSTSELAHLTSLTKLKVSGPQHQPYALNGILLSASPATLSLRSLSLHHAGTIPPDAELAFAPFGALTRLSLRAENAGCESARQLQQVTALRSLQVLEYDGDITSDIVQLLGRLPALREVHTTGAFSISCELDVCLPLLTHLEAQDLRDAGVGLRAMGFLAPQLRHLDVQNSSVDAHCLMAIGCGCGNLTRLKVLYTPADDAALHAIGRGCPRLANLALYAPAATSRALASLAEGCPLLTHLKLMEVNNISDLGLIALARGCSRLVKLRLMDASLVTDAGVVAMMVLRDLEKFVIKGAKGVTGVGMAALATCPRLKVVKVIYCGINKEETRDLFQKQGVVVHV